jgi:hypothetical protein
MARSKLRLHRETVCRLGTAGRIALGLTPIALLLAGCDNPWYTSACTAVPTHH